jgi:hypothetical protein
MIDYYKNLTGEDISEIFLNKMDIFFSSYDTYYNANSKDLYFIGIKTGSAPVFLAEYRERFVSKTTKA